MKIKYFMLVLINSLISSEWINIDIPNPEEPTINVISSNIENTEIKFTLKGFYLDPVNINADEYNVVYAEYYFQTCEG